jgi:hypothetical protein
MRLPRALATATAGLLLVCAPAIAAPDVDSGTFKGKLKRGGTVSFKVTSDKKLTSFRFTGFRLRCSDGERMKLPKLSSGASRLWITDAGRFLFSAEYTAGATWRASGTVDGAKAKGRIRVKVRFNRAGEVDPSGSILCDSTRSFSARNR